MADLGTAVQRSPGEVTLGSYSQATVSFAFGTVIARTPPVQSPMTEYAISGTIKKFTVPSEGQLWPRTKT